MMKVSIAVAVAATIVGCFGAHLGNHFGSFAAAAVVFFYAVAIAAAGFAVWKAWKTLLQMLYYLQICADKLVYMEARMDQSEGRLADVCRHIRQVFEEFVLSKNPAAGENKWWWCSRRVRDIYEAFAASLMLKGASMKNVQTVWRMLQLEVYLRAVRDLIAERVSASQFPDMADPRAEASYQHALENMLAGKHVVDLWHPMELADLQHLEVASPWEEVLKAQILERVSEIEQFCKEMINVKQLFEGTGFPVPGSSKE